MAPAFAAGMLPAAPAPVLLALTLDRGLRLEIEPALLPLLSGWAPVATSTAPAVVAAPGLVPGGGPASGATVRVSARAESAPAAPIEEPDARVGGVRCWVDDEAETALLRGALGGWARVDLAHGAAGIVAPPLLAAGHAESIEPGAMAAELRGLCTIAIALLAGRREGVLVAASAAIAPDGGGWLLVGDASSGKSSTLANLVTAGWSFLGDEEVLVHAGDRGGAWLEGWPRPLPVNPTWPAPRGRAGVDPMGGLARGRWRRTAPLAGILTTRLAPDLPTQLAEATADATLAGLVRATPWLLADSASARYQLGLLRTAARVPGWVLRLGRDTQGDVSRLAKMFRPLEAAS